MPPHPVVALAAVCLEQPLEFAQEKLRPIAAPAHAEVEDNAFTRRAALPHLSLMITAALVVRLYAKRCLVALCVAASQ